MKGHNDRYAGQQSEENRGNGLQVRLMGMNNVNRTPPGEQESESANRQSKISTVGESRDPDFFDQCSLGRILERLVSRIWDDPRDLVLSFLQENGQGLND